MTNEAFLRRALDREKIEYSIKGDTCSFRSGGLRATTLNIGSGKITGDEDYFKADTGFGTLKRTYAEIVYRQRALEQGITIESSSVLQDGRLKLICAKG